MTLIWHSPQLVVDGNMKLVSLIMKCPEGDVSLSNGELFMVKCAPYKEHLANAPQRQPVSSHKTIVIYKLTEIKKSRCSNHRAQNGGCACARHGAFVPHSVVDVQKGEW
jgi:hypothetical protein